jgi:hypothetical protein
MRARIALLTLLPLALVAGCWDVGGIGSKPFRCSAMNPQCPDNYYCDLADCVVQTKCYCVPMGTAQSPLQAQLDAKKNGAVYSGAHGDPGLAMCHETDPFTNLSNPFPVGDSTGTYDGLEICPSGDVDVFAVNVNPGENAKVKITYTLSNGDLDLGVFGTDGMLVSGAPNCDKMDGCPWDVDATHDDACVLIPRAAANNTTYYVAVVGAKDAKGNYAVNRYQFAMTKSSAPVTCSATPPDMAEPPDLGF